MYLELGGGGGGGEKRARKGGPFVFFKPFLLNTSPAPRKRKNPVCLLFLFWYTGQWYSRMEGGGGGGGGADTGL